MIVLKDWQIILGMLTTAAGGGGFVYNLDYRIKDTQMHLAEMSKEFRIDQTERGIYKAQQRQWDLEDRLIVEPNDAKAKRELEEAKQQEEMLKKKLDALQQQGGK